MTITGFDQSRRQSTRCLREAVADQAIDDQRSTRQQGTARLEVGHVYTARTQYRKLRGGRASKSFGRPVEQNRYTAAEVMQVTPGAQRTAAITAAPGKDHNVAHLPIQHVERTQREVATGILHHLQNTELELLDSFPVDVAHLGGRHGGYGHPVFGDKA